MKKQGLLPTMLLAVFATFICVLTTACKSERQQSSVYISEIKSLRDQLDEMQSGKDSTEKYLNTVDTFDYLVFSKQDWTRMHESHAANIKVYWPEGHFTTGIDEHVADLKAMFVYAPDTRIMQHPIRFGTSNMTCVSGLMMGTFTAPMPLGFGKYVQPTGKSFTLPMCTIGIWKDGVMAEKYLYWDNKTLMDQLGIEE